MMCKNAYLVSTYRKRLMTANEYMHLKKWRQSNDNHDSLKPVSHSWDWNQVVQETRGCSIAFLPVLRFMNVSIFVRFALVPLVCGNVGTISPSEDACTF